MSFFLVPTIVFGIFFGIILIFASKRHRKSKDLNNQIDNRYLGVYRVGGTQQAVCVIKKIDWRRRDDIDCDYSRPTGLKLKCQADAVYNLDYTDINRQDLFLCGPHALAHIEGSLLQEALKTDEVVNTTYG